MQLVYANRVKETSTTTGTGTYTLAGAVAGFQSFSAIGNAKLCVYVAEDGTNWEVGIGTYTSVGTTLARTTILASSNAGAAVSWTAGTRNIFCDPPANYFNAFSHELNPSVGGFTYPGDLPSLLNGALVCAGAQSIADGSWAMAIGGYARATGASALAISTNSAYALGAYAVAIGAYPDAAAAGAVAIGGTNNSQYQPAANGTNSVCIGANGAIANGSGAVCIGGGAFGVGNIADGNDSSAVGGSRNTATGKYSTVHGYTAKGRWYGSQALGGGDSSATGQPGAAQTERTIQRKSTTNATTTALEFDANAATNGYLTLPANYAAAVLVHVTGRETSTGDGIAFRLEGVIHTNGSGVPSIVGTPPAAVDLGHSAGAATWTAALAVDGTTNNCLLVNVTGEAAKTIKWVARIELIEVGA